ncbi:hypothetical protein K0U73_12155, partial [bacterium]|nr:hypothetical protein [bacterium]
LKLRQRVLSCQEIQAMRRELVVTSETNDGCVGCLESQIALRSQSSTVSVIGVDRVIPAM